jgi:predicted nucleic acid-binding protein
MPAFYVETSALLKRYRTEPGSAVIHELFDDKRAGEYFVTSHLAVLEVESVAARLRRGRVLRPSQYRRLVGTFVNDLTAYGVQVMPVEDTSVDRALRLFPAHPLRPADALHFAAVLNLVDAVGAEHVQVVSGDKEIIDACRAHALPYIDPEDAAALSLLRSLR